MLISRLKRSLVRYLDTKEYCSKIPENSCRLDASLREVYSSDDCFESRLEFLCKYFINSFVKHSDKNRTRCYYKGAFSYNDRDIDAIEGCTRMLPFIAMCTVNSDFDFAKGLDGEEVNLTRMLVSALISGTDPNSPDYWGDVTDYSQLLCEAADVALALWISRKQIIEYLTGEQEQQILNWLKLANRCKNVDNNWYLFKLTIQFVLKSFDPSFEINVADYERIKSFYVGDGWFSDGQEASYDYYNVWAFHYSLFWLNEIRPNFDSSFIKDVNAKFCNNYKYFFSSEGIPFFGRSVSYRLAASCPIICSHLMDNKAIAPGFAKRAFDETWQYFISKGAIKDGLPTQGYFAEDLRFQDEYSGPSSSLWSLRSLILVLKCTKKSGFYDAPNELFPVEEKDFNVQIDSIRLRLKGNCEKNEIIAEWIDREAHDLISIKAENYGAKRYIKEFISQRPQRPKNDFIKNKLKFYSTKKPYVNF